MALVKAAVDEVQIVAAVRVMGCGVNLCYCITIPPPCIRGLWVAAATGARRDARLGLGTRIYYITIPPPCIRGLGTRIEGLYGVVASLFGVAASRVQGFDHQLDLWPPPKSEQPLLCDEGRDTGTCRGRTRRRGSCRDGGRGIGRVHP